MALKRRLAKTQTIPFGVTSLSAVQVVIIFSGEDTGTIYEKWCYPARTQESSDAPEWNTLDASSTGVYTGVLSEEATRNVEDDTLLVTLKAWDDEGKTRIKQYRVLPLVSTPAEDVEIVS